MKKKNKSKKGKQGKPPPPRENLPPTPLPMVSCGTMKRKILSLLSEGKNTYSMSKIVGRQRATIRQHLRELQKYKLTEKKKYNWTITTKGLKYLSGRFSKVMYEQGEVSPAKWLYDRAHNIKIKCVVVKRPKNNDWLSKWIPNDKLKNNIFYSTRFGDVLITYTKKSVIFQLPVLTFKESEIAIAEAGKIAIALKAKLENEVSGLRLGDNSISAQVISQHHAVPKDPFAKFCQKHGITYKDDLIDIDASDSDIPEIEFTDPEDSHIHHKRYVEYVKDVMLSESFKSTEVKKFILDIYKHLDEGYLLLRDCLQTQAITAKELHTITMLLTSILNPIKNNKGVDEPNTRPDYIL